MPPRGTPNWLSGILGPGKPAPLRGRALKVPRVTRPHPEDVTTAPTRPTQPMPAPVETPVEEENNSDAKPQEEEASVEDTGPAHGGAAIAAPPEPADNTPQPEPPVSSPEPARTIPTPAPSQQHDDADSDGVDGGNAQPERAAEPEPGPAQPSPVTGTPVPDHTGHVCSRESPAHLDPLFDALAGQGAYRGRDSLAWHFYDCRAGLIKHLTRESGLVWDSYDEENIVNGRQRVSYGIARILDDTAFYLSNNQRGLMASELALAPLPQPASGLTAAYRALMRPDPGAKWVALHVTWIGRMLATAMDVDYAAGVFRAKGGSNAADSKTIADFINATAKAFDVDPAAVAYRLASGAGSIRGMAKSITTGHAAKSAKNAFYA
jgi:hypothetical protein